ncbi:hypothetical protein CYG49_02165 [Candidatus Saccharibacteria bacterium]|nr:MAG: hypothetical protein CYG49_02165 [Candidatus Saccharibacteria bacterium]
MPESEVAIHAIPMPRRPRTIESEIDAAYEDGDFDQADSLLRRAIQEQYTDGERIDMFYRFGLKHISSVYHKLIAEVKTEGILSEERTEEASDIYAWATVLLETSLDELNALQSSEQTAEAVALSKRLSGVIDEIIIFTLLAREFCITGRFVPIPATLEQDKFASKKDGNKSIDFQIFDLMDRDEGEPKIIPLQVKHHVRKSELEEYEPSIVLVGIVNLFNNQQIYGSDSVARALIREVKALPPLDRDEKHMNEAVYNLLRTLDHWTTYKRREALKKATAKETTPIAS